MLKQKAEQQATHRNRSQAALASRHQDLMMSLVTLLCQDASPPVVLAPGSHYSRVGFLEESLAGHVPTCGEGRAEHLNGWDKLDALGGGEFPKEKQGC